MKIKNRVDFELLALRAALYFMLIIGLAKVVVLETKSFIEFVIK